ncbi:MAG TPA: hypothetical protein IAB06_01550 [Candidatus Avacidaminococcus intestinavium]|uniref:Ada DNA repair metal-binding domain-containing protein n=1 Tax=Candidatus Avacidaminococcus intestinavium TaxID=2840684 RepID=A0A9D1SL84_9FIRM|nr:hypothetical protein [Candidatus Avacidaminococcus intestinavium]
MISILLIIMIPVAVFAASYVGNVQLYKFHYFSCRYVGKMNEGNKVWFDKRQQAVNSGYVPCKACRP